MGSGAAKGSPAKVEVIRPASPSKPSGLARLDTPPPPPPPPAVVKHKACKFGIKCYRKNPTHLKDFAHPGDRNYRYGLVEFSAGQTPQFETLWQIFSYYDPDESGHLTKKEFEMLWESIASEVDGSPTFEEAWENSGGDSHEQVNFGTFASWAESMGVDWPVGVDLSGGKARCCFANGAYRCNCENFVAVEGQPYCECGHKPSCHRSEFANRRFTQMLGEECGVPWKLDGLLGALPGLVAIEDEDLLGKLQDMLTVTHKTTDNWTRDRGCSEHGRNGCPNPGCAFKNKAPVPVGYKLVRAYRNQNHDLWTKYALSRKAIQDDCKQNTIAEFEPMTVESSFELDQPLSEGCNEWRFFHGSSVLACRNICQSNFKVTLAGTGATWKDPAKESGTPLYGYGIYFAERITKADEYAIPIPEDEEEDAGLCTVLVCRVVGGRANVVTTNEIDTERLRNDVFQGPYHSVYGDRVSSLKKPYREFVVYDRDQVYPEFLITYARDYGE